MSDELRELDALVAEKVMGLTLNWYHEDLQAILDEPPKNADHLSNREVNGGKGICMGCSGCGLRGYGNEVDWAQRCPTPDCPRYSTLIEAAMEVVDIIRTKYPLAIWCSTSGHFVVQIWEGNDGMAQEIANISCSTLPEAICRAALQAMESSNDDKG